MFFYTYLQLCCVKLPYFAICLLNVTAPSPLIFILEPVTKIGMFVMPHTFRLASAALAPREARKMAAFSLPVRVTECSTVLPVSCSVALGLLSCLSN